MSPIVEHIRAELKALADEETRRSFQRFFKEEVACYGVKADAVRKIARKYWKEAKTLSKAEIFALCEDLLRSDCTEEAFVVCYWLPNLVAVLEPADLAVFEGWIGKYVNNWAKCDSFCTRTVGSLIQKHPGVIGELKKWAKSHNRWLRRAAAVSLIYPARKGYFLSEVFEISDMLLEDGDAMVQKGYGWLLKEASRKHQKEVFYYVLKNKARMPRTALRYAIELMPKELKAEAMKRN
ncbi:MAG: DNA alkylation repair protein [Candidatus Bathyarchaeia archaeon]